VPLTLVASLEGELKKFSPRGEARRLVEVEGSRAAAESAEHRHIHPAIEGAAVD
jgi:hypothetical protein